MLVFSGVSILQVFQKWACHQSSSQEVPSSPLLGGFQKVKQKRKISFMGKSIEPRKKTRILSIEYWLDNNDPYNGLL